MTTIIDGNTGIQTSKVLGSDTPPTAANELTRKDYVDGLVPVHTQLTDSVTNNALVTQTNTKLGAVTLTPGTWVLNGNVAFNSTAASVGWTQAFINNSSATDVISSVRDTRVPAVVLNTPANGTQIMAMSRVVTVAVDTEYAVYANSAFTVAALGATGTILATKL